MNTRTYDILNAIAAEGGENQRMLAEKSGYSLGTVNRSIKVLTDEGYIDDKLSLTPKTIDLLKERAPQRAVILAAGYGMRMVPINTEIPKGLIEVKGEPLIERLIKQLHRAGINEIYVVVGFMKERYEYLIDEFGVQLIVNEEYAHKNNLYSLKLAEKHLQNAYVMPCDFYCNFNPFNRYELYSWYMVSDALTKDSTVRVNRKMELVRTSGDDTGNAMIGLSYFTGEDAAALREKILDYSTKPRCDSWFWEECIFNGNKMTVPARILKGSDVFEINTYEQLRDIDSNSNHLRTDAINTAAAALGCEENEIRNITILKKGMTNRSFLFTCRDKRYIMRIPGEGTSMLINRREEASVYESIAGKGICDDIIYINPENGYKITAFLENSRCCDPLNMEDVKKCMDKLRSFHGEKFKVCHEFDLFKKLEFYESLWEGAPSAYRDYEKTKKNVLSLRPYIEANIGEKILCHIDSVPDNFLFVNNKGAEELRLIDWEYAAMQDPHLDIAMFCIYALYDREQIDKVIDLYFEGACPQNIKIKIYCYIAVSGLLWSNWCEYKRNIGVEFGEYSLRQYRYAKDYYKIAAALIKQGEVKQ